MKTREQGPSFFKTIPADRVVERMFLSRLPTGMKWNVDAAVGLLSSIYVDCYDTLRVHPSSTAQSDESTTSVALREPSSS